VESRIPLRAALTTPGLIGATGWADQARAELRGAGERAAQRTPAAQEALPHRKPCHRKSRTSPGSPADGLSNREMGERLYLSPRTIGSHLYGIFPKLDVTSRAQLANALNLAPEQSTGRAQ
jgi:hypothetical protein